MWCWELPRFPFCIEIHFSHIVDDLMWLCWIPFPFPFWCDANVDAHDRFRITAGVQPRHLHPASMLQTPPRGCPFLNSWRVCRANSWVCLFPSSSPSASSGFFFIQLTTLWTWRLALATTFAQVHHLLSLRLSVIFIPASIALGATFALFAAPFAVAPFVDWVEHVETQEFGLFNASLPVFAVDFFFVVWLLLLNQCPMSATYICLLILMLRWFIEW